ncbi:MAG: 50S ribosomal protein L29 [Clostridiales bacterium]|nr:50S ribosomal protein L29 [Clostridiales bacterium]
MKNVDFNSLTNSELVEKLASLKSELFNLRFTHATGSLTNNSALAICKRNIARVKTVIRQRELGLAQAPEKEAVKKSTKKAAKVDAEVKG